MISIVWERTSSSAYSRVFNVEVAPEFDGIFSVEPSLVFCLDPALADIIPVPVVLELAGFTAPRIPELKAADDFFTG